MNTNRLGSAWIAMVLGALVGCGGGQAQTSSATPCSSSAGPLVVAYTRDETKPPPSPPTVEEAQAFVRQTDSDLKKLWMQRDRTSWVNMTHITDDTDTVSASAEEASMEYMSRRIREAGRFDGLQLPPDVARQLWLLKLAGSAPAPDNAKERAELATVLTTMSSLYGKGQYCPKRLEKSKAPCLKLQELDEILSKSRDYEKLTDAWAGWHAIARPIKPQFERYVELSNKGAKEIGFADLGALWRSGYDMAPDQFEAETERLWAAVKPLYDDLHCYTRARLRKQYGADKVGDKAPIPAHLLGNMWAQEWQGVFELLAPFPKEPTIDVSKKLEARRSELIKKAQAGAKTDQERMAGLRTGDREAAIDMVRTGERFFVSLGFEPLPKTFWERSLFTRPLEREVVCHASAWDIGSTNDLRIKMCIKPSADDLITVHHELGHIFYYSQYYTLPILLQSGANDGFHEGIGDTLALSVTPKYLQDLGLIDALPKNDNARLNLMMKDALEKVAFLPFGLLIDKWRWDVFAGKTPPQKYNEAWWALRKRYQGVSAPTPRSEADFDPGAKYHIPGNTPYTRYFLARILQFQFHRALCKAAGHTGPLDQCSIYGNKAAGEKLRAMLRMGATRPWPEALKEISGETQMDPSAMIEYFAPLRAWLQEQNKGQSCGW
ncbi:MAG: M2 family metallopeptidase [Deltaproteobacteria bacterium]|nr:M2 family metallopeptidase [Deltaproteobacteria bacterium]